MIFQDLLICLILHNNNIDSSYSLLKLLYIIFIDYLPFYKVKNANPTKFYLI